MKTKYKIIIIALIVAAFVLAVLSYLSRLGSDSQAERLIYILTALAIAVTAVIALSSTDVPKKQVKASIKPYITRNIENWKIPYEKEKLTNEVKDFFVKCPEPITSHKVQFKITNTSGFDWVNPVVTFWLPVAKRHPQKKEEHDKIYSTLSYNSNTYNTPTDVRKLDMVDGIIISNRNLPYWKQGKHLTIWIKMVLENVSSDPFYVDVSVDCENAEGFTKPVEIRPKELIEQFNKEVNKPK